MDKSQYYALLRAIKDDPSNIAKFREKFRNVYPFSDAVFKLLMQNNAPRLVVFLNAMMGLEGDARIKEFAFDLQEIPGVLNNKTTIFDIFGKNEKGEPVLVEVQQIGSEFFMDRLLYYTSRVISNQIRKSCEYRLPHIYVLSVLTSNQFETEPETYFHHVHFVKNGTDFYPKLDFFFVEVEKFFRIDEKTAAEDREQSKRAEMLRFFRTIIYEEEIPERLFEADFYRALSQDLSLEKYEDELFLKEMDGMIDMVYERQTAFLNGEREGAAKGAAEARRKMAKGLLEDGVPMEIIVRRSGLTEEEIRSL